VTFCRVLKPLPLAVRAATFAFGRQCFVFIAAILLAKIESVNWRKDGSQ
jgi:hypothetical protein